MNDAWLVVWSSVSFHPRRSHLRHHSFVRVGSLRFWFVSNVDLNNLEIIMSVFGCQKLFLLPLLNNFPDCKFQILPEVVFVLHCKIENRPWVQFAVQILPAEGWQNG